MLLAPPVRSTACEGRLLSDRGMTAGLNPSLLKHLLWILLLLCLWQNGPQIYRKSWFAIVYSLASPEVTLLAPFRQVFGGHKKQLTHSKILWNPRRLPEDDLRSLTQFKWRINWICSLWSLEHHRCHKLNSCEIVGQLTTLANWDDCKHPCNRYWVQHAAGVRLKTEFGVVGIFFFLMQRPKLCLDELNMVGPTMLDVVCQLETLFGRDSSR